MIPFGNQRGHGQELAIHLLNEHDNEIMEIDDIRGAVASDLSGAFAEWELAAQTHTRSKKYLYSLSINPDPNQPELNEDQYMDYLQRVEEKLGLIGQPRALVYHTKHGRRHLHVVWSRVDVKNKRVIHMPFDRDKLMMVTREFARDHNIKLPDGYEKYFQDKWTDNRQVTLHEKRQEDRTGLSKQQKMAEVTAAWQQSDSPRAFINALEDKGYILAQGNKRSFILVDAYGEYNSLPRLIDDRSVNVKYLRKFFEGHFDEKDLPSIDEAVAQMKAHLKDIREFENRNKLDNERDQLLEKQKERRKKSARDLEKAKIKIDLEQKEQQHQFRIERDDLRAEALKKLRETRKMRAQNAPKGLAAFLGRVTGVEALQQKRFRAQDRLLLQDYNVNLAMLKDVQNDQKRKFDVEQSVKLAEIQRQLANFAQNDVREWTSLETKELRFSRIKSRSLGRTHGYSYDEKRWQMINAILEQSKDIFASERSRLYEKQAEELDNISKQYFSELERVNAKREALEPQGLAKFLGRITGFETILKTKHREQDHHQRSLYLASKKNLREKHDEQRRKQEYAQRMIIGKQERDLSHMRNLGAIQAYADKAPKDWLNNPIEFHAEKSINNQQLKSDRRHLIEDQKRKNSEARRKLERDHNIERQKLEDFSEIDSVKKQKLEDRQDQERRDQEFAQRQKIIEHEKRLNRLNALDQKAKRPEQHKMAEKVKSDDLKIDHERDEEDRNLKVAVGGQSKNFNAKDRHKDKNQIKTEKPIVKAKRVVSGGNRDDKLREVFKNAVEHTHKQESETDTWLIKETENEDFSPKKPELDLSPPGRVAMPYVAKERFTNDKITQQKLEKVLTQEDDSKRGDKLKPIFKKASGKNISEQKSSSAKSKQFDITSVSSRKVSPQPRSIDREKEKHNKNSSTPIPVQVPIKNEFTKDESMRESEKLRQEFSQAASEQSKYYEEGASLQSNPEKQPKKPIKDR